MANRVMTFEASFDPQGFLSIDRFGDSNVTTIEMLGALEVFKHTIVRDMLAAHEKKQKYVRASKKRKVKTK